MPKIALIGAGSFVFARKLCNDILLTPALQDSTLSLMDIDTNCLAQSRDMVQSINVQELIVEAALMHKVEAVMHAVMLDPLTAAVCTLSQIHSMVDEMLKAQANWLPEFS